MSFSLSVFIQLSHHFVVISLLSFLVFLLDEMLIDDCHKLVVPLMKHLRWDYSHIWLIQEKPIRVLALEYREVAIEKGPVRLKCLLTCHFLLDVVCSVNQVVQHLLLDALRAFFLGLTDNLLKFIFGTKARPENQLILTEHKELNMRQKEC